MAQPNSQETTSSPSPIKQIQDIIQKASQRQSRLWWSVVAVTILLAVCIATFAFPGLLSQQGSSYIFNLNTAVRGLVGLVLIFNVYVIFQQNQMRKAQAEVHQKLGAVELEHKRVEQRAEEAYKIAAIDGLTGLYNRGVGVLRLAEEMARAKRYNTPLTLITMDLDRLKQTNDAYGHAGGDQLIKFFAEKLKRAVRLSDIPVRQGGDEFLVLLPECKLDQVQVVLDRMKGLSLEIQGQEIPLEFASGWANYIEGDSTETFLERADRALYANKRAAKEKSNAGADLSAFSALTDRELQVLRLFAKGRNNAEAADDLGISVRTVETHRKRIMEALDIHTFAELVLFAKYHNLDKEM